MNPLILNPEELSQLLTQTLNAFIIATLVSFLAFYLAWKNGFFTWKKPINSLSSRIGVWGVIKGFGGFFLMQMALAPLFFGLFFHSSIENLTPVEKGYFNLFLIAGSSIGVFAAFISMSPAQRNEVWGDSYFSAKDWFLGIKTWFLAYPLVMSMTQYISFYILIFFQQAEQEQVAVEEIKKVISEPTLFFLTTGTVVFLVPLAEELLFRGFLQNWLKTKMRRESAIGLASAIFALFHFSVAQGTTNLELFAGLMILSSFLGFIYEKQRSIWAPVGLHGFFNGISAMMILNQALNDNL